MPFAKAQVASDFLAVVTAEQESAPSLLLSLPPSHSGDRIATVRSSIDNIGTGWTTNRNNTNLVL